MEKVNNVRIVEGLICSKVGCSTINNPQLLINRISIEMGVTCKRKGSQFEKLHELILLFDGEAENATHYRSVEVG